MSEWGWLFNFGLGVIAGAVAGLLGGMLLDAADVLYSCPRCRADRVSQQWWDRQERGVWTVPSEFVDRQGGADK